MSTLLRHARRSPLAALAVVLPLATPGSAALPPQVVAAWDRGWVTTTCTVGTYSRDCTYTYRSSNCSEVGVAGIVTRCEIYLSAKVTIVPVFNGAGKVVGCTSFRTDPTSNLDYDSWYGLDRSDISITVNLYDAFGDGATGDLTFVGTEPDEGGRWATEGTFKASCRSGYSAYMADAPGPGSVSLVV